MYAAYLKKKTRVFQKAYVIEGNAIYITDTTKAKKRFLKSGIKNVWFGEEFENDCVLGEQLEEAAEYDRELVLSHFDGMMNDVLKFCRSKPPLDEIAVFSKEPRIAAACLKYAKMVSVVGEKRESEIYGGVPMRYITKLKTPPCMAVCDDENTLSPVFKVPRIHIGEKPQENTLTLTWKTMSFQTEAFPFEIGSETLAYFLHKGKRMEYVLTSYRKRTPRIFVPREAEFL